MGASLKAGRPGGGRRGRARRHAPMAEINVTPFVDVMLVLLIIFMVTAPMLATGLPVDLPSSKGGKPLEQPKTEPITVTVTKDGKVYLGKEDKVSYTPQELAAKVREIAKATNDTDPLIIVAGDQGANYGVAYQVLGNLSEAGFKKLSLKGTPQK